MPLQIPWIIFQVLIIGIIGFLVEINRVLVILRNISRFQCLDETVNLSGLRRRIIEMADCVIGKFIDVLLTRMIRERIETVNRRQWLHSHGADFGLRTSPKSLANETERQQLIF